MFIANWTFGNKFQSKLNQNTTFIPGSDIENVVCKMATILFRPQCDMHLSVYNPEVVKDIPRSFFKMASDLWGVYQKS